MGVEPRPNSDTKLDQAKAKDALVVDGIFVKERFLNALSCLSWGEVRLELLKLFREERQHLKDLESVFPWAKDTLDRTEFGLLSDRPNPEGVKNLRVEFLMHFLSDDPDLAPADQVERGSRLVTNFGPLLEKMAEGEVLFGASRRGRIMSFDICEALAWVATARKAGVGNSLDREGAMGELIQITERFEQIRPANSSRIMLEARRSELLGEVTRNEAATLLLNASQRYLRKCGFTPQQFRDIENHRAEVINLNHDAIREFFERESPHKAIKLLADQLSRVCFVPEERQPFLKLYLIARDLVVDLRDIEETKLVSDWQREAAKYYLTEFRHAGPKLRIFSSAIMQLATDLSRPFFIKSPWLKGEEQFAPTVDGLLDVLACAAGQRESELLKGKLLDRESTPVKLTLKRAEEARSAAEIEEIQAQIDDLRAIRSAGNFN